MTQAQELAILEAKREELLKALGYAAANYGDRSVQFSDISKALHATETRINALSATPAAAIGRMYSREGL